MTQLRREFKSELYVRKSKAGLAARPTFVAYRRLSSSLVQPNRDGLACFFTDDSPDFRFDRQHMGPITPRHE
jgi:hypothetical protein